MLDKTQKYVLLGSCFSQYMGERMEAEGYQALCNPLGTLFNPESIRNTVCHALCGGVDALPMFWDEAMQEWRCWWANTRFRAPQEEDARALVQDAFRVLGDALCHADRLFLNQRVLQACGRWYGGEQLSAPTRLPLSRDHVVRGGSMCCPCPHNRLSACTEYDA